MDHIENTLAKESATEAQATETETQAQEAKTYSQEEVDNMMARMRGSLERKLLKPYEELGKPDELKALKDEQERQRQEEQLKRGEFEKTLQELASKKDIEIQKRDQMIKEYRVNTPLIDAAARYDSVNPEQVRTLLSTNVRLNESGEDVEVLDKDGNVRYTDSGNLLSVDEFVKEWLDTNPHFRRAGASTTNTKSSVNAPRTGEFDLAQMDMTNPEHRKLYKEARTKGLL
jgi:hypothetical protein